MTQVWIVDREPRRRAGLARLVGSPEAVVAAPGDGAFDTAPAATGVVLGLGSGSGSGSGSADWEAELEFVHRQRARLPQARWILVGEASAERAARELFDRIPLVFLRYPPPAETLRAELAAGGPATTPLSARARRDAAAERFSRWFAELELPELLLALDPRRGELPLLVRGEPGSGRAALIRYLHHFGATAGGTLLHLPCDDELGVAEIEASIAAACSRPHSSLCLWLDDPDRLSPRTQRALAVWLDADALAGTHAPQTRWVASVDATGPPLAPELERALGALRLELPPLRERCDEIGRLAAGITADWCRARRLQPRRLGEDALAALEEYPWPGNLRELEKVLEQSLAASTRDPLSADDLQLAGALLAPIDAASFATLIPDDEEVEESGEGTQQRGPRQREWTPPGERPRGVDEPARAFSDPSRAVVAERRRALPAEASFGESAGETRGEPAERGLRRLAAALSHQVRNPLATIRTFAELLPKRFDDPDFRSRFTEMVSDEVGRIQVLLDHLDQLAALEAPKREATDVSALLEGLLDARREAFRRRHLLVLKELDTRDPMALADPRQLRAGFEVLLDRALAIVPERGDVYVASRRHEGGGNRPPSLRVLLRFHDPDAGAAREGNAFEHSLELLIAELLFRAQGGSLTLGASEVEERVIVVDLPAP